MKVKVYGASDDLVEIEGIPVPDEIGAWDREVAVRIGGDNGLVVKNRHDGKIGWITSVHMGPRVDDGDPLLWPVSVEMSPTGYSLAVIVECPDGTPVEWGGKDSDE